MSEYQAFMVKIREIWTNYGRSESTWNFLHDWDFYFNLGYRAETAGEAFNDALRCE